MFFLSPDTAPQNRGAGPGALEATGEGMFHASGVHLGEGPHVDHLSGAAESSSWKLT